MDFIDIPPFTTEGGRGTPYVVQQHRLTNHGGSGAGGEMTYEEMMAADRHNRAATARH